PIPSYCFNGPHNFFNAIQRMGFHMELWLANEYDLSYEAERWAKAHAPVADAASAGHFQEGAEVDEHFAAPRLADTITKKDEPWFQHLKKFVDQGISFFKQDGAFQVCEHPDRVWGNGMLDAEMHNLYPLLYVRQMYEGFAEYTGRRPVVFTPCGWTGFQAWCGTWTGDTGGRLVTLGAMLNTSMVGHSWATNDMEVMQKEGIHFGYLQPWSQINSWNYFRMPWVQGKELCAMHKDYARLRARLIPYIYTWAWRATQTGFPLMVPLALGFQDDPACRENLSQYLLGRDLLVCIYKQEAYFPAGRWKDFWTGEVVEGPTQRSISWPANRGGGLYVREGAAVTFGPVMQYRGEAPMDEIEVYAFPGAKTTQSSLYEDDGVTFKHMEGENAVTSIETSLKGKDACVRVGETKGHFEGQCAGRRWSFTIAVGFKPSAVQANGKALPKTAWSYDAARAEIHVQALPGPVEIVVQP
ncbi:MAG TPA: glycoside hydrolase family 31 protein, partial [Candidatus Brocadiia bacterium]|nr:glycoside hydrolase family 31 protein [Candidatus Brocadiia bacterium]